jgi:peroxiredoxin
MYTPTASAEDAPAREDPFETLQVHRFAERVDAVDFSLPLVYGEHVKLSEYKGKVIFLNFWATWCAYCRTERAPLQALYEQYKDRGFVVLSVAIDRTGIEAVEAFVEKQQLTFPNLHDQESEVASMYAVRGVPTTYFLDVAGKIIGGVIGPRDWNSKDVHAVVESLLAETSNQ